MSFVPPNNSNNEAENGQSSLEVSQDDEHSDIDLSNHGIMRPYRSNYRKNFENGFQPTGRPAYLRYSGRTFLKLNYRGRWKQHFRQRNFTASQNGQNLQQQQDDRDLQHPQDDRDLQQPQNEQDFQGVLPEDLRENLLNENAEEIVPQQVDMVDSQVPMQVPQIEFSQMQPLPMQMQAPLMQAPMPNIPAQVHTPMFPPYPMFYMYNYGSPPLPPQQQQQQQPNWPSIIPQGSILSAPQEPPMYQVSGFRYSQSSPTVLPVITNRGIVHYYDYNPVYQPLPYNNPGSVRPVASTWQNQQVMALNGGMMGYNGQPGNAMTQNGSFGMDFRYENSYSPIL